MSKADSQHDILKEIPSPSARLWAGLSVILSTFVVFSVYTLHEIRWLEDFQVNVVQKNRKASLQLLRLQNDAYLLALSLREVAEEHPSYPIIDWRAEFARLREDMDDAVRQESKFAVAFPATAEKRAQLQRALQDFWRIMDRIFVVAGAGREAEARALLRSEAENQRAVISESVARLLVLNDRAQAEATETITQIYGRVRRNVLIVIGVLFVLALATGLYTFQASCKTFEKLRHLAEELQRQSEQLRKLSWKLIDVQEETLREVAHDLHDEFGQILTAIGVLLSRAGGQSSPSDPVMLQELDTAKQIVEETLEKVRDRSQMFRPAILDDFGLQQTLKWFTEQFSRQAGIQVKFEARVADGLFPPEDAIHVYRIVQEALSNIARHSRAREAWVLLDERDGEVELEVGDNGAGFEVGTEMKRAVNLGLMGMRERATHLGGSFSIVSVPGKRTTVRVRLPVVRRSKPKALIVGGKQEGNRGEG